MAKKHIIVGVHISNRVNSASEVQAIFTEFGCNIKTRLGLHTVKDELCSPEGIILLEMVGCEDDCCSMVQRLDAIDGVQCKQMVFECNVC